MVFLKNIKAIMIILDGYGVSTSSKFNAVASANTPFLKTLFKNMKNSSILEASGEFVGLPKEQIGNSEVGHLHLGAGRVVSQGLSLIQKKFEENALEKNTSFLEAIEKIKENNSSLHILGLLSNGGVHSHEDQIIYLIDLAAKKNVKNIFLHIILDGRDVPPKSAMRSLQKISAFKKRIQQTPGINFQIASIIGRKYTMDRDSRWQRLEKGYRLLVESQFDFKAAGPEEALKIAYDRGETDEFISPTWCLEEPAPISSNDLIIVSNFRADRAREITFALTQENFNFFKRTIVFKNVLTLTQYDKTLEKFAIFPQEVLKNTFAEVLSQNNKKQLHLAETEKFAHVTFFFNGNRYDPFEQEDRILIPSDRSVATYDLNPVMQAQAITTALTASIENQNYDFILVNFANPDMVGHTGDFDATVKALEAIDKCLKKVSNLSSKHNFELFITSDHGNAEEMFHSDLNQKNTEHTQNPVPFFYQGKIFSSLIPKGSLIDVAPTILTCLNLPIPKEMTGNNLGIF